MRKAATTLGVLALALILAAPVMAGWGRHRSGTGVGTGAYDCPYGRGAGYANLTDEEATKLDELRQKFYNETRDIRDNLILKSRELDTVMAAENPDMEKAKQLQKEISDLRSTLDQKRLEHRLEMRKAVPDAADCPGYGRGYGMGYGGGMHGGMRGGGYMMQQYGTDAN